MSRFHLGTGLVAVLGIVLVLSVVPGCGGHGGHSIGTATGPGGGSFQLLGQSFDGPVRGAILDFYYDAAFSDPIAGVTATTRADGTYDLTFDVQVLRAGTQRIYARSRAGETGVDADTGQPAARLTGFATVQGNRCVLTLTALSTLVVETLQVLSNNPNAPTTAEVILAVESTLAIFGVNRGVVTLDDLNSATVTRGTTLEQANDVIVRAARLADPVGAPAQRITNLISSLATGFATGTPDIALLSRARLELTTQRGEDNLNHIPLIQQVPTLTAISVFIGNETYLLNGPVVQAGPATYSTTVTATSPVVGQALPNVGINFSGLSRFPAGTHFEGNMSLVVKGRGTDQRTLTLQVSAVDAVTNVTQDGGTFLIPVGASLTCSGNTIQGNLVDALVIEHLTQNLNIDLFNAETVGTGSRLTFGAPTILSRIAARFGITPSTHPIGLLQSAGTFDLTLTYTGLPIVGPNGRITQIHVNNLVVN
ncbi:MAG: hypothetical protein HY814_11305 [Candidatus Riflebacteria bacterium]|nr:hypothetical protein [Candidatus Riflebacteria bacterium]